MVEVGVTEPLKVDIWSDVVCPWCYLGERRFSEGVRQYREAGGERPVVVEFHSFELSPDTPADFEGGVVAFLSHHKGLPVRDAQAMLDQMTALAASEGLTYDFASAQHANTRKAHELLHFAKAQDRQAAMVDRLFRAYFTEGRNIGRIDDLASLAGEVGLDAQQASRDLTAGTYAAAVSADIEQARAYGINAVPFFVVDGRYGVAGAQSPQVIAQTLAEAAALGSQDGN
jgi:predicted DsbA family dithiol-disulfide isomerase